MFIEGKPGPVISSDQTLVTVRLSKDAGIVTQDGHARYQEAVYRGNVWSACNQASQALTALATAMTGFILFNPSNSGKNAVLWDVDFVFSAVPASGTTSAQVIVLAGAPGVNLSNPTGTTSLAPLNNLLNTNVHPVCNAYSTATWAGVTPVIFDTIAGVIATGTATLNGQILVDDPVRQEYAGSIIIPPGAYVAVSFVGGAAPSGVTSMTWEEINV